jgi:hypothetical protein
MAIIAATGVMPDEHVEDDIAQSRARETKYYATAAFLRFWPYPYWRGFTRRKIQVVKRYMHE